jgi:hypothetical protein
MAKNNLLNVILGVDTKGYAKTWDEVIKITQESGNDLEKEAAKMALAVKKKIENMSPKSQARQFETLTTKMIEMGMEGTQAFNMVTKSAAGLKATIDDAKGLIDAMRPDAPFNALNTTLGASAQAFAGVQGAMALFGSESEDLQKTLIKVQGAMALAEGFKAIDGLTDGFQQLNMVIKQNPLIAGAAIFAAATAAIIAMTNSTDELTVKTKAYNDISQKAFDSTVEERVGLEQLLRKYNDKNTSDKQRLEIQRQLVEQYPKFLGQISTERVETDNVNNAVKGLIGTYKQQAEAQAAKELYIEALKKEKKLTKEFAEDQMRLAAMGTNPAAKWLLENTGIATGIEELKAARLEVETLAKAYDTLAKKADDATESQTKTFGVVEPDKPTGGGTKTSTANVPKPTAYKPYKQMSPKKGPITGEDYNPFPAVPDETIQSVDVLGKAFVNLNASQIEYLQHTSEIQDEHDRIVESMARLEEVANVLNQAIKALAVDAISSFSMAIGETIGGSEDAMESFGKKLLGSIAAFMENVSKAMIAAAIASDLFQKQLFTNPYGALAAGIALGIAAGIVKSKMTKGVQGEGFAKGGLIGGNSFSGDKLFAPVNSGEVILNTGQQNALLRLANGGGSGYMAETRIAGRDLAIVLKKYQIDNARG